MSKFSEKLAAWSEKHPRLYEAIVIAENLFKKPVFRCRPEFRFSASTRLKMRIMNWEAVR